MKHGCRYLLIFGIVYTLGIWGFSAYFFHSQVKKMETLFDLGYEAKENGLSYEKYFTEIADLISKGFYRDIEKATTSCLVMGSYYACQRKYDLASFWFHMDEKLNNTKEAMLFMDIHAYGNLALFYLEIKHFDKADFYMKKTETLINKYVSQYLLYGDSTDYLLCGDSTDAFRGTLYYAYGLLKLDMGDHRAAISFFNESEQYLIKKEDLYRRNLADIHYSCSKSYFNCGDYRKSREHLKKAIHYLTFVEDNRSNLIAAYLLSCSNSIKTENYEEAKEFLNLLIPLEEHMTYSNQIEYDELKSKLLSN